MKPLLVIPMPCEARLFFRLADEVAKRWEADHPGQKMPVTHMQQQSSEFGKVTVIWDEPVTERPEASDA